jgi:hypothetical protein
MGLSPISPDIIRLLKGDIQSPERLQILLALFRERPRAFTAKTLRALLSGDRSNSSSTSSNAHALDTHLAILCGRGFLAVTIGNDLLYAYKPISDAFHEQISALWTLWDSRPGDVLAVLNGSSKEDAARAFADAFRLNKRDRNG